MKTCTECKINKELENFYQNKHAKDGLCYKCKNCIKKYKEENREKINKKQREYQRDNAEHIKQYRKDNKEKINQKEKEYWQKNREKIIQRKKLYYQNNRERLLENQSEYRQENKEKLNQQQREYIKERRKNDPQFRIATNLRTRTAKGIVSQGGVKSESTEKLLGCTWEEARSYIESLFLPGMTWENYPKWHIDHIRPMTSFDLIDPEQQKLCCYYTNLRPLWAEENLSKGSLWNGVRYARKNIDL